MKAWISASGSCCVVSGQRLVLRQPCPLQVSWGLYDIQNERVEMWFKDGVEEGTYGEAWRRSPDGLVGRVADDGLVDVTSADEAADG